MVDSRAETSHFQVTCPFGFTFFTTFGFRGEALSSLCALCESVTIVTATKETAPLGAIIKLGKDGRVIDSTGKVARPVHPLNRVSTGADGDREVPRSP